MRTASMREAIAEARRSMDEGGGPFGAVIVHEGRVIGRGTNRVVLDADPTAHAEILAIRAACRELGTHDLSGAEIFTSCEPCPMCLAAIHWARLDRIEYAATRDDATRAGFDDALVYREIELSPEARSTPATQSMYEEGLEVLRLWSEKSDRVPY